MVIESTSIWAVIIIPLLVAIIPAVISYFAARSQANSALRTAKEQQAADLQKVKEQHNVDMEKMKEQQNAEIQKIREQALHEIERIQIEVDKQAELYEKNAQVDVTKDIFAQMIGGDMSAMQNLMKLEQMFGAEQSGTAHNKRFKSHNHPKKKR